MKLLLIQPPVQDFYDTDVRLQPIGLCFLKSTLKKYHPDIEVEIRDFHHGHKKTTIPYPKELNYLKQYYGMHDQGPFSSFDQYYHFGLSFEEISDEIKKIDPDIVGISSLFTPYYREVLEVAKIVKKIKDIPVILGGSHVSASPNLMLEQESVDFIIRGEGERPIVELLKAIKEGGNFENVSNLGFKRDGKIVLNPMQENYPIDEIPIPDLRDFSYLKYTYEKRPMTFIVTSRSCPYRCSFCSVHKTFGNRYRRRKNESIIDEMKTRYDEGYRVFDFEDDNLTFNLVESKKLFQMINQTFEKKDIQILAMNGISFRNLDDELLELMRDAGLTHLNISLVTIDEKIKTEVDRDYSYEQFEKVVDRAHELGLKMVAYQIIGMPGETVESMLKTLQYLTKLPVIIGASIFYLVPEAPISKQFGALNESDLFRARLTAMAIESEFVKRDELYTLFITSRIINFLKDQHRDPKRLKLGKETFQKLFDKEKLFISNKQGVFEQNSFSFELFKRFWDGVDHICSIDKRKILKDQAGR